MANPRVLSSGSSESGGRVEGRRDLKDGPSLTTEDTGRLMEGACSEASAPSSRWVLSQDSCPRPEAWLWQHATPGPSTGLPPKTWPHTPLSWGGSRRLCRVGSLRTPGGQARAPRTSSSCLCCSRPGPLPLSAVKEGSRRIQLTQGKLRLLGQWPLLSGLGVMDNARLGSEPLPGLALVPWHWPALNSTQHRALEWLNKALSPPFTQGPREQRFVDDGGWEQLSVSGGLLEIEIYILPTGP